VPTSRRWGSEGIRRKGVIALGPNGQHPSVE